ncbi:hypothetical protein FGU65_01580 [Methanoculleus sp. FWC-SCC1]|uniref:Uncharacterized protein n=1 Tax=Methanoculleus frigidifontis TaxID=2584085 RepID=A0ABT8M6Q9_9EURY|nr:hypothetical protein [Methanoculleus sp. FWC-SCC1]MDN7023600.1 hypothetical protein [Methanoculleus sp. FWC-SCC1]
MENIDIITEGSVSVPNIYHYRGVACTAVAVPFLVPGEGDRRERVYHRYECARGFCHAVVCWAPGSGGLPSPHLEAFDDEDALFAAYPCLRDRVREMAAGTGWLLRPYRVARDIFQRWRDEAPAAVDIMPIELPEKCCFLIRLRGWMSKPLYSQVTLPVGLLEFRQGEAGAAATLRAAGTVNGLAALYPDIRPYLDHGLQHSLTARLEQKRMLLANFGGDRRPDEPLVTVLPLQGGGRPYLLVRRRFVRPIGSGRDCFTLLAWTGEAEKAESVCAEYATLGDVVREHPDLEAPLVNYYQDVVPTAGGGAE